MGSRISVVKGCNELKVGKAGILILCGKSHPSKRIRKKMKGRN